MVSIIPVSRRGTTIYAAAVAILSFGLAGALFFFAPVMPDPTKNRTLVEQLFYKRECNAVFERARPSGALNRISLVGDTLWAVGTSGRILRSADNGKCWDAVSSPTTETLNAFAASKDGRSMLAVGTNGTVLESKDSGTTWSHIDVSISSTPSQRPRTNFSDAAVSANGELRVVVGGGRDIYWSRGERWSSSLIDGNLADEIFSVAIDQSNNDVWIGGRRYFLLSTKDFRLWVTHSNKYPNESAYLMRITVDQSRKHLWAVGNFGYFSGIPVKRDAFLAAGDPTGPHRNMRDVATSHDGMRTVIIGLWAGAGYDGKATVLRREGDGPWLPGAVPIGSIDNSLHGVTMTQDGVRVWAVGREQSEVPGQPLRHGEILTSTDGGRVWRPARAAYSISAPYLTYVAGFVGVLSTLILLLSLRLGARSNPAHRHEYDPASPSKLDADHLVSGPEFEIEGLNLVSAPANGQHVADVVFVHGLDGDPFNTWARKPDDNGTFWPKWLADDIQHLRIWSYGYHASTSTWLGGTGMRLKDRATNFLHQLKLNAVGKRPVIFVSHSLGGLVVKRTLVDAMDDDQSELSAISKQTRSILFFATPHLGSEYASAMSSISLLTQPGLATQDLVWDDPQLDDLADRFRRFHANCGEPQIYIFYESDSPAGIGPARAPHVVSRVSACYQLDFATPIPVQENHKWISKPRNRSDLCYKQTVAAIKEAISNEAAPRSQSAASTEQTPAAGVQLQRESQISPQIKSRLEALQAEASRLTNDRVIYAGRPETRANRCRGWLAQATEFIREVAPENSSYADWLKEYRARGRSEDDTLVRDVGEANEILRRLSEELALR